MLIFIGKGEDIMPRGVRKSPLVKLRDELKDTQDSIEQYKAAIKTLQEKEKQIQEEIKLEEFKEVSTILEEQNMSLSELKELLISKAEIEQGS
jgi:uncharacterized protein YlxW (UPF0749 family)